MKEAVALAVWNQSKSWQAEREGERQRDREAESICARYSAGACCSPSGVVSDSDWSSACKRGAGNANYTNTTARGLAKAIKVGKK